MGDYTKIYDLLKFIKMEEFKINFIQKAAEEVN